MVGGGSRRRHLFAAFPLTLALSLGERGQPLGDGLKSGRRAAAFHRGLAKLVKVLAEGRRWEAPNSSLQFRSRGIRCLRFRLRRGYGATSRRRAGNQCKALGIKVRQGLSGLSGFVRPFFIKINVAPNNKGTKISDEFRRFPEISDRF
jgi:hypothetical protein